MKVYISGPISDHPDIDYSFDERLDRFARAARELVLLGHQVANPVDVKACVKEDCGSTDTFANGDYKHTWQCYMRYDIIMLVQCESIAMLPDWYLSKGATAELNLAIALGFPVFHLNAHGEVIQ